MMVYQLYLNYYKIITIFKYYIHEQMEPLFPGKPAVTSVIIGARRRLIYLFDNKSEMVEEYDIKTHQLLLRKIKKPSKISTNDWVYEMGEEMSKPIKEEILIQKSNNNPIFTRKDTLDTFQWRIRNLVYPSDVYRVRIDPDKDEIVIETSNKKYYKRFQIPDLKRGVYLKLIQSNLSWQHNNNTLIVSYKKPQEVLQRELQLRKQFEKLNAKKPKQNDIECSTQ